MSGPHSRDARASRSLMEELLAIVYTDPNRARRAFEEIARCESELEVCMEAASVIVCEGDGSCELTTSQRRDGNEFWPSFWNRLLGVLLGAGDLRGIDPRFQSSLQSMLAPGISIFLLALPVLKSESALDALGPLGGDVLRCNLEPLGR